MKPERDEIWEGGLDLLSSLSGILASDPSVLLRALGVEIEVPAGQSPADLDREATLARLEAAAAATDDVDELRRLVVAQGRSILEESVRQDHVGRMSREHLLELRDLHRQASETTRRTQRISVAQAFEVRRSAKVIEELESIQGQLREAREAAEAANRAKSRFLASVSHELRTPLNAIIGYSEMLIEESGESPAGGVDDLEKIRRAGRHLLGLINEILDVSRIESGGIELALETFDVRALVDDVVSFVSPMVAPRGNTLVVEVPDEPGRLRSDPIRMRQCLINVLGNACKFTENGTIRLAFARRDDETVEFVIEDSGIGIPLEAQGRIFDAFDQGSSSPTDKAIGAGLGLTISRQLCRVLGGDISVASIPGQGSTFTLRFGVDIRPAIHPMPIPLPAPGAADDDTRGSILVIDDDPVIHDQLGRHLSGRGYRVLGASTGEEGLHLARIHQPLAITLDVRLPGMDGWSVLRRLRDDPILSPTPVIMVSVVDEQRLAAALGASHYLVKPIDRDRLVGLLDAYRHGDARPHRALVFEPDPAIRQSLLTAIREEGWIADCDEDRQAVLARAAGDPPDLALVGLESGGSKPGELIRELAGLRVPVVLLSSDSGEETTSGRSELGLVEVLDPRSMTGEQLVEAIHEILASHETPGEEG